MVWALLAGVGLLAMIYTTVGYGALLALYVGIRRGLGLALEPASWPRTEENELPGVSVLLPVLNEAGLVSSRLANLVDSDYPSDRMEILVVSDGSTDGTEHEVRRFAAAHPGYDIRLRALPLNGGKHAVQNWAAAHARHAVLVFTDVETRFERGSLRALVAPLADPGIGVVGGRVRYLSRVRPSAFDALYDHYRCLEYRVRRLETRIGIGCKTDGSCAAARRSIWRPLAPFEAEDQVIHLLARQACLLTVHADDAVAVDVANARARQEFAQRRRMTRKAFRTWLHRWKPADALRHPGFTVAYLSHKILRFFVPVFALAAVAGLVGLGAPYGLAAPALAIVLAALATSYALSRLPRLGRVFGLPYALLVANVALLAGVVDGMLGRAPSEYVPTRRL